MKTKLLAAAAALVFCTHATAVPIDYQFSGRFSSFGGGSPFPGAPIPGPLVPFNASFSGSFVYDADVTSTSFPEAIQLWGAVSDFTVTIGDAGEYGTHSTDGVGSRVDALNFFGLGGSDQLFIDLALPTLPGDAGIARRFAGFSGTSSVDLFPDFPSLAVLPAPSEFNFLFFSFGAEIRDASGTSLGNWAHFGHVESLTGVPRSVPEPDALLLLATGLIGVAFTRRAARRRAARGR